MVFKSSPELFGFEKFAILKKLPSCDPDIISFYLSGQFSGELKYLNNFERPARFLKKFPYLKSIITLLSSYYQGEKAASEGFTKYLARFSWGYDYHLNLKKAATDFFLSNFAEVTNKPWFVVLSDNHPLNEKFIANCAGLGFFGKNSLLINRELGSFFNITLILTEADFEERTFKETGECGNCEICFKACPAGALEIPNYLKVNRCISFHTIENKKEIPLDVLKIIEKKYFYGCDICQTCCPYNSGLKISDKGWNRPFQYEKLINKYLTCVPTEALTEEFRQEFSLLGLNRFTLDRFKKNYRTIIEGVYE